MFQQERKPTYTIVAFRYNQQNSIMYENTTDRMKVMQLVDKVLGEDKADIISIRRVYAINLMKES